MKKKFLSIILTICCFLAFDFSANAIVADTATDTIYDIPTITSKKYNLRTGYYAKATFAGTTAFCMDPGKKPIKAGVTDCIPSVLGDESDFGKAAKYIFSQKTSESQTGGAIRIVSIATTAGEFGPDESNNSKCGYIAAWYLFFDGFP